MLKKHTSDKSGKTKKYKNSLLLSEPFEWTEKQSEMIKIMTDHQTRAVFVEGPAGTGKTHSSVFAGLSLIQQAKTKNLVYVRSIVEASHNNMGFLPGSLEDKEAPYMEVFKDTLDQILTPELSKQLLDERVVQTISTSFIRGKTLRDAFIIVDEAQNMDSHSLISIITRIGDGSKIVFLFDPKQSDLKSGNKQKDITKFNQIFDTPQAIDMGIHSRKFTSDDIMRSAFCKFVVQEIDKHY